MTRRLMPVFLPLAMSLAIVLSLGLLPALGERQAGRQDGIAVFLSEKPVRLSDANLVDWLASLPRAMELKHAEWDGRTLMLDYQAGGLGPDDGSLYDALSDLTVAGFAGTDNVHRLRIRVFDPYAAPGNRRSLLVALDAARESFQTAAFDAWQNGEMPPEAWLSRYFRLTGAGR